MHSGRGRERQTQRMLMNKNTKPVRLVHTVIRFVYLFGLVVVDDRPWHYSVLQVSQGIGNLHLHHLMKIDRKLWTLDWSPLLQFISTEPNCIYPPTDCGWVCLLWFLFIQYKFSHRFYSEYSLSHSLPITSSVQLSRWDIDTQPKRKERIKKNRSNEKEEWRLIHTHTCLTAYRARHTIHIETHTHTNKCRHIWSYVGYTIISMWFFLLSFCTTHSIFTGFMYIAHFNADTDIKTSYQWSRVSTIQISLKLHIMFVNLLWFSLILVSSTLFVFVFVGGGGVITKWMCVCERERESVCLSYVCVHVLKLHFHIKPLCWWIQIKKREGN